MSVSEFVVKDLDHSNGYRTHSTHLQNNSVKNKGYGTQAEILSVKYAFKELNMVTVFADAILKNLRSQHVLRKAGFRATHQDDTFITDETATVGISQINKSSIYLYIIAHPPVQTQQNFYFVAFNMFILVSYFIQALFMVALPL